MGRHIPCITFLDCFTNYCYLQFTICLLIDFAETNVLYVYGGILVKFALFPEQNLYICVTELEYQIISPVQVIFLCIVEIVNSFYDL